MNDARREFAMLAAREPVPLARGALLIAKEEYPDLDVAHYLEHLAALGRAGNGLPTRRVLEFQLAHARAQDAVHAPFNAEAVATALQPRPALLLQTQARDRTAYLMNPQLGRALDDASRARLSRGW